MARRHACGFRFVRNPAFGTWNHRNAEALCSSLGFDLVAHDADVISGRTDERDLVGFQNVGELGVFRQEAIAGMDGIRAGDFAGRDDLVNVEIAVTRGRRTDADTFVSKAHMHGICVSRRMDGYSRDAQFAAGPQDAQGDFTTVGDEDLVKHLIQSAYSIIMSGWPNSTGEASSIRIAVTVPERGAGIWFIVFMASIIRIVWPSLTFDPISTNALAPGAGEKYAVPTIGDGTELALFTVAVATGAAAAGAAAGAGMAYACGAAIMGVPWRETRIRSSPCSTSISVKSVSFRMPCEIPDQCLIYPRTFTRHFHALSFSCLELSERRQRSQSH